MKKLLLVGLTVVFVASLANAELMMGDHKGDWYRVKKTDTGYIPYGDPVFGAKSDTVYIGINKALVSGYYFPGRAAGTLNMQLFVPPAECKLMQIEFLFYSPGDCIAYIWMSPFPYVVGTPDAEELDSVMNYFEFEPDSGETPDGWVTIPAPLVGPMPLTSASSGDGVAALTVLNLGPFGGPFDIGDDPFFMGYIYTDATGEGRPWPLSDANAGAYIPNQTYQYRTGTYDWRMYGGYVGNWCFRVLVDMYGNPPPEIDHDKMADTYSSGPYPVEAGITDNNDLITRAQVYWAVNPTEFPPTTWDSTDMVLVVKGDYTADIPAASTGDTIYYFIEADDEQPRTAFWPPAGRYVPQSFIIRQKGAGDILLMFGNLDLVDDYAWADALDPVHPSYDIWYGGSYGAPDSSVLLAGYDAVLWADYGGDELAVDSAKALGQYLDSGTKGPANLLLMGQDVLAGIHGYGPVATNPGEFAYDYLHATNVSDDAIYDTLPLYLYGADGDPVAGDFFDDLMYYDPMNTWAGQDIWIGQITTDGLPDEIFFDESDNPCGWKYASTKGFKWVFPYFQLGAVEDEDDLGMVDMVQTRKFMYNVLTWFGLSADWVNDVGLYDVEVFPDTVGFDSTYTPTATVRNYGFDTEDFDVELIISDLAKGGLQTVVHSDTQAVTDLEPSAFSDILTFAAWTVPSGPDTIFEVAYRTLLAGDVYPGNDEVTYEVFAKDFGVAEDVSKPFVFRLHQNRPNPIRNTALIKYSIPARGNVVLKIYNIAGQCVKTLVNGEMKAGVHTVTWDGRDENGKTMAAGIYFYRLVAGNNKAIKKLVLLR